MAQQGTEIVSSTGRIVWGHPAKMTQRTDVYDKPIFNDDGTPAMGVSFGLAIPKADFLAREWPAMSAEAQKGFPQGVPQNFSWKMKDGDTDKDSKGVPLASKEGYAGCYILTITSNTGFPPSIYKWNQQTQRYDQVSENEIKTGDYVSVALNFVVNIPQKSTHTPSLYVNPQAVELVGYGTPLGGGGVDPMKAFGGQQRALPPGASAAPVSGAPGGVSMPTGAPPQMQQPAAPAPGGYPQQPQPGYPAPAPQAAPTGYPAQPQPGYPAQPQHQQPAPAGYPAQPGYPAPAHDFVQQPQMQPAPGGYPQQPAAPAGYPAQPPGMMPPR